MSGKEGESSLYMIEEEDSCGKSDSDVEESCATGHDARDVPVPETNVEKQQMQILDANEGQSQPRPSCRVCRTD